MSKQLYKLVPKLPLVTIVDTGSTQGPGMVMVEYEDGHRSLSLISELVTSDDDRYGKMVDAVRRCREASHRCLVMVREKSGSDVRFISGPDYQTIQKYYRTRWEKAGWKAVDCWEV